MFAQKFNQKFYLCRTRSNRQLIPSKSPVYNWFIIKSKNYGNSGYIPVRHQIYFPKELIGEKIRLKIEIIKR